MKTTIVLPVTLVNKYGKVVRLVDHEIMHRERSGLFQGVEQERVPSEFRHTCT